VSLEAYLANHSGLPPKRSLNGWSRHAVQCGGAAEPAGGDFRRTRSARGPNRQGLLACDLRVEIRPDSSSSKRNGSDACEQRRPLNTTGHARGRSIFRLISSVKSDTNLHIWPCGRSGNARPWSSDASARGRLPRRQRRRGDARTRRGASITRRNAWRPVMEGKDEAEHSLRSR
jgi:hypothetical protein